jgi:hypothetical protein
MTQADRVHSTPPTNTPTSQRHPRDATSRRRFLRNTAAAAGGTALALAIPPAPAKAAFDPVFDLTAAHRGADTAVNAIVAEINRAVEIDEIVALEQGALGESGSVELGLFLELTEAVPTTLAGVVALVTHLDWINKKDPWKFEDNYATPVIGALAVAFSRIVVAS